jgi:hypothetical protein
VVEDIAVFSPLRYLPFNTAAHNHLNGLFVCRKVSF